MPGDQCASPQYASGIKGQKPSLGGWSTPPPLQPPPPPLVSAGKYKERRKSRITSSLRVKDRPRSEKLLRVLLLNHIAHDYTLCHLHTDLAFSGTQLENVKQPLSASGRNRYRQDVKGGE